MTLQAIDHVQIAIPVGGEEQARPFYRDLLGLTEVPKPADMALRGGCWFEAGAVKVHLGAEADFKAARKAHVAFRVDDVAGLAERASAAGYEIKTNDEIDGVERVFVYDPFGNRLEFLRPAMASGPERVPDPNALSVAAEGLGIALPLDYASFLARTDGYEGVIGELSVVLWRAGELGRFNRDYQAAEYAPGLALIGSDGGGEGYAFDTRASAPWPVVMVPFIGMDVEYVRVVATDFTDFLEGRHIPLPSREKTSEDNA